MPVGRPETAVFPFENASIKMGVVMEACTADESGSKLPGAKRPHNRRQNDGSASNCSHNDSSGKSLAVHSNRKYPLHEAAETYVPCPLATSYISRSPHDSLENDYCCQAQGWPLNQYN